MAELAWDDDSAAHIENCTDPDCERCEYLTEFYMGCDGCGHVGHQDSDGWELIDGRVYCLECTDKRQSDPT